jgi:hypothetical protein
MCIVEFCLMIQHVILPWRRGAADIASALGTEDLGSNPARVLGTQSNAVVCT